MSIYNSKPWIKLENAYLANITQFTAYKWLFVEALSIPYEGLLSFCTTKPLSQAQQDKLIFRSVKVSWQNEFGQTRFINGIVFAVNAYRDKHLPNYYCYRLVIKSWYSALYLSRDAKTYVDLSVRDIVRDVLKPHLINEVDYSKLRQSYAPRPYTVRYNDTADNFLNRIFYESGMYYTFRHDNKNTYLVLHDACVGVGHPGVADKMKVYPEKDKPKDLVGVGIWDWLYQVDGKSDAISSLIYDRSQSKTTQQTKPNINYANRGKSTQWYSYPSFSNFAKLQVAKDFFETARCAFSCNDLTMVPGAYFIVSQHPNQTSCGQYWVDRVETLLTDYQQLDDKNPEPTLQMKIEAVPDNLGYYPTPYFTPIQAKGVDSARVVGPEGKEVFSDEQARVKVKFEWDTHSESHSQSSCWVPVKQAWAGFDHGTLFVPRIGQEVIIAYEDGHPEKPIVIGTLSNQENLPPFTPEKTPFQSGYKSHTPGDIVFNNGNILRFDDDPNTAGVYLQAQKDLETVVEGDKQTTINDEYTHTITGGNYTQNIDGSLQVTSDTEIQLAVGMSRILINQEGIVIESPKINIDKTVVTTPPPKPTASAEEGLQQLLATLAIPDTSNAQDKLADDVTPIPQEKVIDVVYSTGQKVFYFLTQKEQELIQKESKPYHDAMVKLHNAEQAVLKATVTSSEKIALLEARQGVDNLLKGMVGSDNFQELVKFKEQGWAYIPNKVLDKVGLATAVKVEDGKIMYTPVHKQWGKAQQKEVLIKKVQGKPTLVSHKSSTVNITDAMAACDSVIDKKGNLFNFDTKPYEDNLTKFAKKMEEYLTTKKDKDIANLGWVDIKAGSSARILRYTAKAGINGNYDPQKHMLVVNAGGDAKFDLFSAEGHTTLTFPDNDQGYHGKVHLTENNNDGLIDLGLFKCEANIKVYEDSGASILAYGSLTASANPAFEAVENQAKKLKNKTHSSNLLTGSLASTAPKETTDTGQGESIQADAFAGIEAGCYLDGKFYWKSPETVQPVQNPNKASEKLGSINGIGEPSWVELADLGTGVAADLGIGGGLEFCIRVSNNKFVLVCHAKFVWGWGASGKMQIAIDADHMNMFIQFVYHQLKNQNFSNLIYENLMDPNATNIFNAFLIAYLWEATIELEFFEHGEKAILDWYNNKIYPIMHHKQMRSKVVTLAQNILADNVRTQYLPPESKGRLLYQLSLYFIELVDTDKRPAQAMMKILAHVQSEQELIRTYANVTPFEPDGQIITTVSDQELAQQAIAGQKIILKNLQAMQIEGVMEKEQDLYSQDQKALSNIEQLLNTTGVHVLNSEDKFIDALKQMAYNTHINMGSYQKAGAMNVLETMYALSKSIRKVALQQQKTNQYQVDIDVINTLRQKAQDETLVRNIQAQQALDELQNSWWLGIE